MDYNSEIVGDSKLWFLRGVAKWAAVFSFALMFVGVCSLFIFVAANLLNQYSNDPGLDLTPPLQETCE